MNRRLCRAGICLIVALTAIARADYVNFESAQVHPLALAPGKGRLAVVNTPDATVEIFRTIAELRHVRSIRVGLEPTSLAWQNAQTLWVVSSLSDSVSVVDVSSGRVVRELHVGDEPTDVAFAGGRAFVSLATDDALAVYELSDLDAAPTIVPLFGRKPRALAVSPDGTTLYAIVLFSGNRTTVVAHNVIHDQPGLLLDVTLAVLGQGDVDCIGPRPSYPPYPEGIERNPELPVPPAGSVKNSLIVRWNEATGAWEDETGQSWNDCLRYRLPDLDLFAVDVETLEVSATPSLGTNLFDLAVHPDGRVFVTNTEARNAVRFEHPLGVAGHVVDNRLSIVDPAAGTTTIVDLNAHIDRSVPAGTIAERAASLSQPGMLVWNDAGDRGLLVAIGSRKLFEVDGGCVDGACIFGPDRARPRAVEVGEGPSGVAWNAFAERAWVLNRFDNTLVEVDTAAMQRVAEIPLHDPSGEVVREGRRFLYDGELSSAHGDAACSSCHLFGDRDGLAWDLGNPEGEFVPYSALEDNLRFIEPDGTTASECDEADCSLFSGFDPEKGPMTTQTLRGMLEPLHWRGDRPTFNDFNGAFVGLLGAPDVAPEPELEHGLSVAEMERFREFALGIRFPPNPYRNLDDTLPDATLPVPGHNFSGNPASGEQIFLTEGSLFNVHSCVACHQLPFGAGGGVLGGVEPTEPTSPDAAAMLPVTDFSQFSAQFDLKPAQLRNMYEKWGARQALPGEEPVEAKSGFGYMHDGGSPNLGTFLAQPFSLNPFEAADVAAFLTHFDTGTPPAVGASAMLPAGTEPVDDPERLATLEALGDADDPDRHCELTASLQVDGERRGYLLRAGRWWPDRAGALPLRTSALRAIADSDLYLLCVPRGSGERVARDRDEDGALNRDDCAPADPRAIDGPAPVSWGFVGEEQRIVWPVSAGIGYQLLGGAIGEDPSQASCLATTEALTYVDPRPDPAPGEGYTYVWRAVSDCGLSPSGALDSVSCEPEP